MLPALVLAAGLGTRLDPLTRLVAKPAVPIAGRTLIESVLDWLRGQGTREVVINLHHLPGTLTALVGDGSHLGLRVRYSWERMLLGSAGGPRHALALLPPVFCIVNGDTLCKLDLAGLIAAHERSGAAATLAVVHNPAPDRYNGIVADERNCVESFVPKGRAHGTWHFVGIQVVSAAMFAQIPDGEPAETIGGIYRDRVARGRRDIQVHPVDVPFIDVGTPEDYLDAVLRQAPLGPDVSVLETPAAHRGQSAGVRRSVVWPDASIGAEVNLDGCVVAGVHLPSRFTARRAVLVSASLVRPEDSVEVVGDVALFPMGPPARRDGA